MPNEISTYNQRQLPKFSSEIVAKNYIIFKNLKLGEYNIFCDLTELRNDIAKCQDLLKSFYEENFYRCDFLVFNCGTLESAESKQAFSMVSF